MNIRKKRRNNRTGTERKENVTRIRARIFSTSSDTISLPHKSIHNFFTLAFIYFCYVSPNKNLCVHLAS